MSAKNAKTNLVTNVSFVCFCERILWRAFILAFLGGHIYTCLGLGTQLALTWPALNTPTSVTASVKTSVQMIKLHYIIIDETQCVLFP